MILDRYILRQFLATLLFSLFALCVIFVVVNLLENLDSFLDKNTPPLVIARYYLHFLPEIIKLLTPVSMLLASLFTVGRLANQNEVTAMKSGGMSIYRLMFPLLLLSFLFSGFQLYFNGWIVPASTHQKAEIERKYLQKSMMSTALYNLFLRDTPTRNILLQYYDDETKSGTKISIEEYSSEIAPRLLKRIDALTIHWNESEKKWMLRGVMEHDFTDGKNLAIKHDSLVPTLNIRPAELLHLQKKPEELTFDELRLFIDLSERGGKDVRRQLINYYGQYAFPFANFIVVLFGIPFSSNKRKGGLAMEIGAAMFVSFIYLAFTKIGQSLGYTADISPIISAWIPNAVFAVAGMVNIFRIKS